MRIYYIYVDLRSKQQTDKAQPYATAWLPIPQKPYVAASTYYSTGYATLPGTPTNSCRLQITSPGSPLVTVTAL